MKQPDTQRAATESATAQPSTPERLAVDAKVLAGMLGVSVRTVRAMDSSGKLPRPVRPGGHAVRWVVREIKSWLAAGAPERAEWESVRKARN